eukprot:COSAG02_NODE_953_length_15689_cov_112.180564_3_plen_370_part_00
MRRNAICFLCHKTILLTRKNAIGSVDYPDFIQQNGELFVAETDKHTTRTHHVPRDFWLRLLQQNYISSIVRDISLIAEWNATTANCSVLPLGELDKWRRPIGGGCSDLSKACATGKGNGSFSIELSGKRLRVSHSESRTHSNLTLLRRNKAPRDIVGTNGTIPGLCYEDQRLSLQQCSERCASNVNCSAFWHYDSGRCCPKRSFDLQHGWTKSASPGGFYAYTATELVDPLLDCRDAEGNGVAIFAAVSSADTKASEAPQPVLLLASGSVQQTIRGDSDAWKMGNNRRNTVAVVVDGAAQIATFVTNGVLTSFGESGKQGWTALDQGLGSVAGAERCIVSKGVDSVRVYSRSLMTTELVGMWRAAASSE